MQSELNYLKVNFTDFLNSLYVIISDFFIFSSSIEINKQNL
ncbi:hypothetical protein SLEP1_g9754 [Rubroshorea leprosula]|uniref:ATP synthase F0 subunit 8 n=1 Tax=Rubroshorea leprosula TaxID=152421 RepID=A0AAV5IED7_9ROSI|nr:hypothetical protein SLEP1_g9754 [Rubroshorea leprosula]